MSKAKSSAQTPTILSISEIIGEVHSRRTLNHTNSILTQNQDEQAKGMQKATALFMMAKQHQVDKERDVDKLLQKDQMFKGAKLNEEVIRTFFAGYELPWEELHDLLIP